jgi:hypothetical protein
MRVEMSNSEEFMLPEIPDVPESRPSNAAGKHSPTQQGSTVPQGWRPTLAKPLPSVQCTGTIRNGERKGERCTNWSYAGATVCIKHGAALPNVQKAAEERKTAARLILLDAAPEATEQVLYLMKFATQENVRLAAARDVLDRAGVKANMEIDVRHEHTINPIDIINQKLADIAKSAEEKNNSNPQNNFTSQPELDIIESEVVPETADSTQEEQTNE